MSAKPRRTPSPFRRAFTATTTALNGDLGFHLLFLGGGLLLLAAGAGLVVGVGGWLAVLGGLAAAGLGIYLVLIWLFGNGMRGR